MTEGQPLIFNIHRLAMDDGPGLRSTVFFKGCPLSCDWCHNPEAMKTGAEVAFFPKLCLGCGACEKACPEGAIEPERAERLIRARCTGCGRCAEVCPSTALRLVGIYYPVQDLVSLLLRDRIYYQVSGGGVTFSGGEPTLHLDYLETVLATLRSEGIHAAIQTCGYFPVEAFVERILPLVDLVFFDLKLYNPEDHARLTGRDNSMIFDSFTRLTLEAREKIIPRIPLVPGRTATRDNLQALASFVNDHGYGRCDLKTYNPGGLGKRLVIGMPVPVDLPESLMDVKREDELREFFAQSLAGEEVCRAEYFFQQEGSSRRVD
ncbi:MAG: glycyl-radical enzyme activating protein, partial [Desulfobulbaceae bacterium]|nr:glycyl-radical enzyme activating protein [Desulfobulbaceae bacterium]